MRLLKPKNILIYLILSFSIIACKKDLENSKPEDVQNIPVSTDPTLSYETRAKQPLILGQQKNNPFSVQNMKIALDSLRAYAKDEDDGSMRLKSLSEIEVKPTDLYVRFLPLDSNQYKTLMGDTTLTLFDFPLDYEIKQNGDFYHDSTITTPYTWQYTTVKPGFTPPTGIKYEVLSELFIVENSEDYTEEIISDTSVMQTKSAKIGGGVIDRNIGNALYAISFTLTGNEKELNISGKQNSSKLKSTVPNCTRYCVGRSWWKVCWTSCDPYYYPDGYIKVNTPSGDVGLKGAKVRMWRWFSYADARTDANGYYYCSTRFNSLWIGNSIDYHIIFDGVNGSNNWTFSKSLFGALCLWTNYYGAGSHSPNGHSMTFYTNSDYWGRCVLNNAVYDYCNIAKTDGISLPPSNLDIANKQSSDLTSGAPLLNNHINWSLVYAYPNFWGVIGQVFAYDLFGWAYPDLMLRFTKNMSDYNKITAIAWHELTHASQVRRMTSVKGLLWASDYWSANVYQQASNNINNGSPYGSKGDTRWQIIALSEGWANFREWKLASKYLSYSVSLYDFPRSYAYMFNSLYAAGCSYSDMESSLCTYSISGFRDNLIAKYPALQTKITSIISSYL